MPARLCVVMKSDAYGHGLDALLATAVMYLFLRSVRVTLAGVLGIPICIIVAFLGLLLAGLCSQNGAVDRLRLRPGIQLQQAFRCCHLPLEPALMDRPAFEFGQFLLASPQCAQGLDPQLHGGPRGGSWKPETLEGVQQA